MSYQKAESISSNIQFNLGEFQITEDEIRRKLRSNSCIIPGIQELAYCLDLVPKLK